MKHFYHIVSLLVLAGMSVQAAPARTFNSTQTFNSQGIRSENANWFYEVQPLPAQVQPLKAPTVVEKQNAATQSKPVVLVEKDLKPIPAPRPPKRKTVKDTRKVDVTSAAYDPQKVLLKAELDPKAESKTAKSAAPYQKPLVDRSDADPNSQNKSLSNGINVFQPSPPPKPRHHGFRDWP